MNQRELQERTKQFSLRIIKLIESIPNSLSGQTIARQIIRCGTSVGANYRSACRAKSDKDFLNKMVIIEEEADETCYWLELLIDSNLMQSERLELILKEANELTAIFTASGKTVRAKIQDSINKSKANPKSEIRNSKSDDSE